MLKVGLIGVGSIASGAHLKAYERIAEEDGPVLVEACCDVCPEKLEKLKELQYLKDVRIYTEVEQMLEAEKGRLDYVDICVPTYLHAEIAVKAMEAGFHVLSEKPMARTVEQAQDMIDAAKRTGKTLMAAYCNRFYGAACEVKNMIDAGEFGAVRHASFTREGGSEEAMGWKDWFHDGTLSGGAMLDLHIHDVDMIRWMFGMPRAVSAAAASYVTRAGYDAVSVNYLYDKGVYVHASCDWTIPHDKFNTRTIRVDFQEGYVYIDRTAGREAFVKVAKDGTVTDRTDALAFDAYYNEILYFADCLMEGKPVTRCLPEETMDSVRIIMAEMESADQGGARVEL